MYDAYARRHGWKVETLSSQPSDMGGFRDVTLVVKGDDAWSRLKYEAGPHRVQRVPVTESQGRVHTSAATVAVLPEAEEIDVEVDPKDLDIEVFRSSGPGGQSVNTTDSAVRITHKPSGLVVSCQDEKSQLQNKDKAMRILRSRLLQLERERQDAEVASARRSQVKGGGRSEKIRTYNYKENRVTDHRVGVTLHALEQVLAGEAQLDEIVDALASDERRATRPIEARSDGRTRPTGGRSSTTQPPPSPTSGRAGRGRGSLDRVRSGGLRALPSSGWRSTSRRRTARVHAVDGSGRHAGRAASRSSTCSGAGSSAASTSWSIPGS